MASVCMCAHVQVYLFIPVLSPSSREVCFYLQDPNQVTHSQLVEITTCEVESILSIILLNSCHNAMNYVLDIFIFR